MIAALILAAGESRRMQAPKALMKIGQLTFAEVIARKLKQLRIEVIYLIVGPHNEEIKKELKGRVALDFILNTHYREGQLSSLKEGLRSLPTGSTEALVWPVDQPLVKVETVQALISTFEKERKHLTIPVFNSQRGHPVLYDIPAIHTAFSLGSRQTAKELQKIYADETTLVEVNDPGVVVDIDTPEDYQKYITDAGL